MERPFIDSDSFSNLCDYFSRKNIWRVRRGYERDVIIRQLRECAALLGWDPDNSQSLVMLATVTVRLNVPYVHVSLRDHFHIEMVPSDNSRDFKAISLSPNTDLTINLITFKLASQLDDDMDEYQGILLSYRDVVTGIEFSKTIISYRDTIRAIDNLFPKCSECGVPLYDDDVDGLCQECREHYSDEHPEEYTEE